MSEAMFDLLWIIEILSRVIMYSIITITCCVWIRRSGKWLR